MGYAKELETDIYTIGVSIPLNFSSNKSEYERASLMHQSSAISLQNEQAMANKKYQVRALEAGLSRDFQSIEAQEQNIHHYANSLLPLMKKSYDYGESSVIEYLLSQQKLHTLQQELLEKQKGYYQTLFQLYSMSEKKDR
jgi:outer membrane protein TolC